MFIIKNIIRMLINKYNLYIWSDEVYMLDIRYIYLL